MKLKYRRNKTGCESKLVVLKVIMRHNINRSNLDIKRMNPNLCTMTTFEGIEMLFRWSVC